MMARRELAAAAIERAAQRTSWALAAVTHGSLSGAELEIDRARVALESAAFVIQVESSDQHRQLPLPWGAP